MEFSTQESWSGLPCPPPGDVPDPGVETLFLLSAALAGRFFITSAAWEAGKVGEGVLKHPGSQARVDIRIPSRDFPSGPAAKTQSSQCRGPRFNPWAGN